MHRLAPHAQNGLVPHITHDPAMNDFHGIPARIICHYFNSIYKFSYYKCNFRWRDVIMIFFVNVRSFCAGRFLVL